MKIKLLKKIPAQYLEIVGFVLLIKLLLLILGSLAFSTLPFAQKNYEANFHFPVKEKATILPFKTWDSQHYIFLAEHSYKKDAESNRFFPLYPFLISIFNVIFKNSIISGLLLSLFFSLGSAILMYEIAIKILKSQKKALFSVILLFSFPSAFYLSLIYPESLFLFLILLFFYSFEKRKIFGLSIAALLLPLTRPTGMFIIFPLLFCIFALKGNNYNVSIPTFNKPLKLSFSPYYLLVALPILGILSYFLLMNLFLHDPFVAINGQSKIAGWDIRNVVDPMAMIKNIFISNISLHGFANSIFDRIFFIFFCILLPFIYKKMSRPYFIIALFMGFVPMLGNFISYMRYLLPVFPIFIVLSCYFEENKFYTIKYALLALFVFLQAIFFIMHILNYWVA